MILSCQSISKSFGTDEILKDVSFHIEANEKAAIVGINGAGKSTLLKIIMGEETSDAGEVILAKDKTIGYLAQYQDVSGHRTIYDEVLYARTDILEMEQKLRDMESEMNSRTGEELEKLMDIYHRQSHEFELQGGYAYRSEVTGILKGLGFSDEDLSKQMSELSGGQKTRVSLGKLLVTKPDVLLLDEPTNHLDAEMAEWLENYLKNYRGAMVMVTHDRYFLDSVCNRIVEVDKGQIYSYETNYSGYLAAKQEREDIAWAGERKRQSILRKEIEWMQRGARARSTKQKAHIQRYEALRDQKKPDVDKKIEIGSVSSRMGKTTVELSHITKTYGDHVLISDFSYIFLKNDRIGFVGKNGCGKTTLMKIIDGRILPDAGEVTIGQTIKIGYYTQEIEQDENAGIAYMDPKLRVIDYIKNTAEYVRTEDGLVSASAMLDQFLFPPEEQYGQIKKLSGGEKRRLNLLRVLMEAPNVLILDEPTNDLDITTLTILEDYLDHYDGIVITVSHDRYFLDRVVHRIFAFEGNGKLCQYEGGYTDYHRRAEEEGKFVDTAGDSFRKNEETANVQEKQATEDSRSTWKHENKLKFSYKEQKEYETIEDDIAALETRLGEIDGEMASCARDFVKLNELTEEKTQLETQLEEKMDRWTYLEELAAKILQQNA